MGTLELKGEEKEKGDRWGRMGWRCGRKDKARGVQINKGMEDIM